MKANVYEGVVAIKGQEFGRRLEVARGVKLIPQNKIDKQLLREIQKSGIEVDSIDENGALFLRLCK